MGEYDGYNVEELFEMTSTDDAEAMEKIGVGWANTSEAIGTLHDALIERLQAIKDKWTSASSGPFFDLVNTTIVQLNAAKTQTKGRAEAVGSIASYAKWAQEKVSEQYKQYLTATVKNAAEVASGKYDSPIGFGNPHVKGPEDPPSAAEIRRPFDEQARKYMNVALKDYETQKPQVISEVQPIKPIPAPDGAGRDWSDGQNSWPGDGGSGSNASDMAGLSAVSYGGNTVGAQLEPSLQNGGQSPTAPVTPAHTGGTPPPNGISNPIGGFPPGGVPSTGPGKPPSAPPKLPMTPTNQARNTLGPRGAIPASRTPGLPIRNSGQIRSNVPTNGTANRWAGRGLQKSQMAPVNRVGEPRKAGEVLGRRPSPSRTASSNVSGAKPTPRRVQSTIVRGANKSEKLQSKVKSPTDNTKRGFTSRVINPRNRLSHGYSRTSFVGKKLDTTVKPEPFGKRPEPESRRKQIRREIEEARAARRKKLAQTDGLSRPVIDNGVTNSAQLDRATPTAREAVKSEDGFWNLPKDVAPGVIGKRDWDPKAIAHDPGPVILPQTSSETSESKRYDPGPTGFHRDRRPDTTNWPGV